MSIIIYINGAVLSPYSQPMTLLYSSIRGILNKVKLLPETLTVFM